MNKNVLLVIVDMNKKYIWHMRLSHIHQRRLKEIQAMSKSEESLDKKSSIQCPSCVKGKQHRVKFMKESTSRATQIL
jgi:hypothetical protein